MTIFGNDSDPGSDKFHVCPECGKDEIYSQNEGILNRTKYFCNNCGYEAKKGEVKKKISDIYKESKERRMNKLDSEIQNKKAKKQRKEYMQAVENTDYSQRYVNSLVRNAEGPGVTAKRLTIDNDVILDALDDGEQTHCLIKGAGYRGIEFETGDEVKQTGIKGGVKQTFNSKISVPNITIATDKRILALHPLITGTDEYSIPYDSVDHVRIDRGFIKKRIQVTTRSRTYYFEAVEEMKLKPTVDYIRKKTTGSRTPTQEKSSHQLDPVEKLEKLSELNQQGVISDDEFEKKKSELIDKI